MKTKAYRNGTLRCRGYLKDAGNGWEVGFLWGAKPIFLSNFTRSSEANRWFALMNREVKNFARRHKVAPRFPKTSYGKFLSSHLYNAYFAYLDRLFARHQRVYSRAVVREQRAYKTINRRAPRGAQRQVFLRAA